MADVNRPGSIRFPPAYRPDEGMLQESWSMIYFDAPVVATLAALVKERLCVGLVNMPANMSPLAHPSRSWNGPVVLRLCLRRWTLPYSNALEVKLA
jgi:hypothetical protein